MKKFIIAAIIVLITAITTLSFAKKETKTINNEIKIEKADLNTSMVATPKSDISTAD